MTLFPDKVVDLTVLADKIQELKTRGKTVAMCHGCFDILHAGHLRHFQAAKAYADVLVVTVTPDAFINKGPMRPIFFQNDRAALIAGLDVVSWVALNTFPSAVDTIRLLKPSFFIKGQEYEVSPTEVNPNFLLEKEAVLSVGGDVRFTYEEVLSSTAAFKKMMAVEC
jgi:rfaE bifunctional protein nucleotidyltransferase chain/domain